MNFSDYQEKMNIENEDFFEYLGYKFNYEQISKISGISIYCEKKSLQVNDFLSQLSRFYDEFCQSSNFQMILEDEIGSNIITIFDILNGSLNDIIQNGFFQLDILKDIGKKKRDILLTFYNFSQFKLLCEDIQRVIRDNYQELQQSYANMTKQEHDDIEDQTTVQSHLSQNSLDYSLNDVQSSILCEFQTNNWISNKFLHEFTQIVATCIDQQDWKSIEVKLNEYCLPINIPNAELFLKKQFNQQKQQQQDTKIIDCLKKIEYFNQRSNQQVLQDLEEMKQIGLNNHPIDIYKQIFEIELVYPFIYKNDPILLDLYLDKFSKPKIDLTLNQLKTLSQNGYDSIVNILNHFTKQEINKFQGDLMESQELFTFFSTIKPFNLTERLLNLINKIKIVLYQQNINTDFLERNIEKTYIFNYQTLKKFVKIALQQEQFYEQNKYECQIIFSDDLYQNIYVRTIIQEELYQTKKGLSFSNQKLLQYFQDIFQFYYDLIQNPLELIKQICSNDVGKRQNIFIQEFDILNTNNLSEFLLDFIKILIRDSQILLYLLRKIFENELKKFNLDLVQLNELFDQFSQFGLNYFYQYENIEQIQEIERTIKENKLLQYIFGKDFYDQSLITKESYINYSQIQDQSNKLNMIFKYFLENKIKIDDCMVFKEQNELPIEVQIKEAAILLSQGQYQNFVQIIFNIILYLSQRNQDLSQLFQKLTQELMNLNIKSDLLNQKSITEYFFKSADNEVSYKLTQLLGYSNPIPLIQSQFDIHTQQIKQTLAKNSFWLLSNQDTVVASFGIGYQRGKSTLLNELFLTSFEISNKSFVFQQSADIQSNKTFKTNQREYFVVDFHGDCLETDKKYLKGFYKFFIIQLNHNFLKSQKFSKFIQSWSQVDENFERTCFLIRDYSESKPNFKEYFCFNEVRQKLNISFFKDKNVIIIPNLTKQQKNDKEFIISQSRSLLDSLIITNSKYLQYSCRDILQDTLLNPDDEEKKIFLHVRNISQKLIQIDNQSLFGIYPIFQQYSRLKLKLQRKHFLQNSDIDFKYQEVDDDRDYNNLHIRYSNYSINDDQQRSVGSQQFEQILISHLNFHNTIMHFISELKYVNKFKLNNLNQKKKELKGQLNTLQQQKKNVRLPEIVQIEQNIRDINELIDDNKISIEIMWREIIQLYQKHPTYHKNQMILDSFRNFIDKGYPFEIIDGENFYFPKEFLSDVFQHDMFKNKKLCVVSIIGPQNSGKSTLLNYLLGCDFNVSDGRCTRGIYGTIIKSKTPQFDLILVIDSEGLQSLEKNDPEYDRKITLFCLTVSHLVIINVKDQLTNDMLQLLEVCISARQNIESNTIQQPIIEIVFNQKADPNQNNAQQAIDNAMRSLESNKLLNEINVSNDNVTSLPSAVTLEIVNLWGEKQQQWRYLKTQVDFVERVKKLGVSIFNKLLGDFKIQYNNQTSVNKETLDNIDKWIDMASTIYQTISLHPTLTAFKDIRTKQVDFKLKEYIKCEIDKLFNLKVSQQIEQDTAQLSLENSELYINKLCEEKRNILFQGYERVCNTFEFDIGEVLARNKNYINIQIDSFKINYLNEIKISKNTKKVFNTLDQSIYVFDKKIKDLKLQNCSVEEVNNEFNQIFDNELKQIENNIPTKKQTITDAIQFVSDQYKRYCQSDLISYTNDETILNERYIDIQLNEQLQSLIQRKEVFYGNNNQNKKYIFNNKTFQLHLEKFCNSIINQQKLTEYYNLSIRLLELAFAQLKPLTYFTKPVDNKTKNSKINKQFKSPNQQPLYKNQNEYNHSYPAQTKDAISQIKAHSPIHDDQNLSKLKQMKQIDYQRIKEYNQTLSILKIKVDQSFIQSQIEQNLNIINNKTKLIIFGNEEYITIQDLYIKEQIEVLITKFNEKSNQQYLMERIAKKIENIINKQQDRGKQNQLQYWKPFIEWVRGQLQNNMGSQDIIDITQFIKNICQNLKSKIKGRKVTEMLIQSICGYINNEIKLQEDLIEIFNIKFQKNFKSFIHSIALMYLFNQESQLRTDQLYKPINDFKCKKEERRQLFIQKFETQDNNNHSSALQFYQLFKEFTLQHIEKLLKEDINKINHSNEISLSRIDLQEQLEASLTSFSLEEANEYLSQPEKMISKILEKRLNVAIEQIKDTKKKLINLFLNSISDFNNQIININQHIHKQIKDLNEQEQENNLDIQVIQRVQQIIPLYNTNQQEVNQSFILKIQEFKQNQIEEVKMNAFSHFIFNILTQDPSKIVIQNTEYTVQLDMPLHFSVQIQNRFIFKELKNSSSFNKILINNLTEFIQSFGKYLKELEDYISSIDTISTLNIENEISDINQRILSCQAKCPCCDQSCDQDHWKFKGIPIGENENKHTSKSGHRFVAFKGVQMETLNQPALILCSDYKDENLIIHKNQKMAWKEFKQNNPSWEWNIKLQGDQIQQRAKWSYLWKLVGKQICKKYDIKNYISQMSAQQIEQCTVQQKNMHFIFALDESQSMKGQPFKDLYKSLKEFINQRVIKQFQYNTEDICSIIGFNNQAYLHVKYEKISSQTINRVPIKNRGGGTSFENAFEEINEVLSQNRNYDENIVIVFLSDGEGKLPLYQIKQLKSEYKGKIKQFWTIGFGNYDFQVLKQIAVELQDYGGQFLQVLDGNQLIQEFQRFAYIIPS